MPPDSLALTKHHRPSHAQNSRPDKQAPAQFVQKLYQIVDDDSTDHLIKWTESGDSFVVLDHERLGRELLGHWFKHQNWSTFVRQLNMYGFRKQPHLQRGVLKGGADSEYCNYEHPYFKRGQPELLGSIHRKNQQTANEKDALSSTSHSASIPSTTLLNTVPAIENVASSALASSKRNLDVTSILEGITAIKHHQASISSELQDLRNQNSRLWEQTYESQTRFQRQEDTINRILRFLAGVFGRHPSEVREEEEGGRRGHSDGVITTAKTRKPQRLMIGDVPKLPSKVLMTEVEDEDDSPAMIASIESPAHTATTPSVAPTSPMMTPSEEHLQPISGAESLTLAQLMQTEPEQLKKLLAALSQQPVLNPPSNNGNGDVSNAHQLTPYSPQFDFSRTLPSPMSNGIQHDLVENDTKLQDTWNANQVIDQGVNDLQNSLSEFMANIGMDTSAMNGTDIHPAPDDGSFDFDALFHSFDNSGSGNGGSSTGRMDVTNDLMFSTSFDALSEPSDHTSSPALGDLHDLDPPHGHGQTSRGQKRKSDVADLGALGVDLGAVDTSMLPLSVNDHASFQSATPKRRK